jgi:hypothetical protein
MTQLPSIDPHDSDYLRLKYVRYADDWLIGFIGTKEEAEEIKQQVKTFLHDELKLELSEEKTTNWNIGDSSNTIRWQIT